MAKAWRSRFRRPWFLYLPRGFWTNPLGFALSLLLVVVGMVYTTGLSQAGSIATILDERGIRAYGMWLFATGLVLSLGLYQKDEPLERLGCRMAALAMLVFAGWVWIGVGIIGVATICLALMIAFLTTLRASIIKYALDNPVNLEDRVDTEQDR